MPSRDASSRDKVVSLMREHNFPSERIDHSIAVADLAIELSALMANNGLHIEENVVEKGALLHDVGYLHCKGDLIEIPGWEHLGIRIPTDDINHPMTGALVVKEWGFSDKVTDCVLKHNIGGFTIEECTALKVNPIPEKDCAPITAEEKVVHYADHLMFLKRAKLDPLKDPQASAEAVLPWLRYYFMERAHRKIELGDPIVQREVKLNNELKRYLRYVRSFRV